MQNPSFLTLAIVLAIFISEVWTSKRPQELHGGTLHIMETHIKRGIKFILYIVAATIGFTLIMLGFQHKTGKSAADSSSFFAPQVFADAPGDNSGGDDDDATGSTNGNDGNDDNSADSSSDSGGGND